MTNKTKIYIAGDWNHDKSAIEQIQKWNEVKNWNKDLLSNQDLIYPKDNNLNCANKSFLHSRISVSKIFILIVGDHTNTIASGGCQLCRNYDSYTCSCKHSYSVDYRSFIKYECDKALEAEAEIIVFYKSILVDKNKCPQALRNKGIHVPMVLKGSDDKYHWDYKSVKSALDEYENK